MSRHSRLLSRAILAFLAPLSLAAFGCQSSPTEVLPVPSSIVARDYDVRPLADGRVEAVYSADVAYPSREIEEFYDVWATENGMVRIDVHEDRWNSDQWYDYEELDGTAVDQFTTQWKSVEEESLLVILRHVGDRSRQDVYVVWAPFYLPIHPPDPLLGKPVRIGL